MPSAATWIGLEIIILSEVTQKEKDKYHMISLICGTQKMTQMNLPMKWKQTHRHRENNCGYQGEWWWRDGLGVWDQQMQTIIQRMDKQQCPTLQHRELYSISCDKT